MFAVPLIYVVVLGAALVADHLRTNALQLFVARPYVSPRERKLTPEEIETREVAYALKDADPAAIRLAARELARLLPEGPAVLVPIPSSSGDTSANRALAIAIAELTGVQMLDVLERTAPVESSRERRLAGGRSLPVAEHQLVQRGPLPLGVPIYLVDNVVAQGHTLKAAHLALGGRGHGLVWALPGSGRDAFG